jgi:hypothetical protein
MMMIMTEEETNRSVNCSSFVVVTSNQQEMRKMMRKKMRRKMHS